MNAGTRSSRKQNERAAEIVAREAALFIKREAGSKSLITVTRAQSMSNGERVVIFVSVFPAERAGSALAFLERQREEFSKHMRTRARLRLPHVDFLLDKSHQDDILKPLS